MARLILKNLSMKNFATFENQVIDFHQSFNGIVGETGSGKSLILDAFQLLLGSRADKKLVRKDTDFAIIEGVFHCQDHQQKNFFDEIGFPLDDEGEIVVKRILYSNGKSKCYLNHLACPLVVIKNFSRQYIDLVGQFENQKLATADYQLKLLDLASKNEELLTTYKDVYTQYKKILDDIETLTIKHHEKDSREDYLRYQIEELSKVELKQDIEDDYNLRKNKILAKEEAIKALQAIQTLSSEGEHNVISSLGVIRKLYLEYQNVLPEESLKLLDNSIASFEEFSFSLASQDNFFDDEESIEEIMNVLDIYQRLKRKYRCSIEELQALLEQYEEELSTINDIDLVLKKLEDEKEQHEEKLMQLSAELHEKREKFAVKLEKKITAGLNALNMKGATFKIALDKHQTFTSTGRTTISFQAETNKGEGFYGINDIASGGELSRILLTLRNIITTSDSISIFFFDEIDTGIGGETAKLIAAKLKSLSEKSQILAITHLPQIAKVTDKLIYVDKKSFEKDSSYRTISFVSDLTDEKRKKVIDQLAGL